MVAYSFKPFFVRQIELYLKTQTIRGNRPRHARPGEPVQIYQGMRTAHCRKIIADPICKGVWPITIEFRTDGDPAIRSIEVGGRKLNLVEIETFAGNDGFLPQWVKGHAPYLRFDSARQNMAAFWRENHPDATSYEGVLIQWKRAPTS